MRFNALEAELAQLRIEIERDELGCGVIALGDIRVPKAYCDDAAPNGDDDGEAPDGGTGAGGSESHAHVMQFPHYKLASSSASNDVSAWAGPLTVDALVQGSEPGYTTPIVVRLHFPAEYPGRPAQPQFLNKLQHFTVDPGTGRPNPQLFDSAFQQLLAHAQAQTQQELASAEHKEANKAADAEPSAGSGSLRVLLQLIHIFLSQPLHPCDHCDQAFASGAEVHASRASVCARFAGLGGIVGASNDSLRAALERPIAGARAEEAEVGAGAEAAAPTPTPTPPSPAAARLLYTYSNAALTDLSGSAFPVELLHPELRAALDDPSTLRSLATQHTPGVFSVPFFTDAACALLLEESSRFDTSGLPRSRPNSMNRYGLVLDDVGLLPFFAMLRRRVLQPLAAALFAGSAGTEHGGVDGGTDSDDNAELAQHRLAQRLSAQLDAHHAFLVEYRAADGGDKGLDMHTDDSDVTFNVCLGRDFDGAGLTFCGELGSAGHRRFCYRYQHVVGRCVLHLGRKRHGADDITKGERVNLIIWTTNQEYRRTFEYQASHAQHPDYYAREEAPPDAVCLSYTHDRDFEQYKSLPPAAMQMRDAGHVPWCPPQFAEYGDAAAAVDSSTSSGSGHGGGGKDARNTTEGV